MISLWSIFSSSIKRSSSTTSHESVRCCEIGKIQRDLCLTECNLYRSMLLNNILIHLRYISSRDQLAASLWLISYSELESSLLEGLSKEIVFQNMQELSLRSFYPKIVIKWCRLINFISWNGLKAAVILKLCGSCWTYISVKFKVCAAQM